MPKPAIARQIAFDILVRVAHGAYASELLIDRAARLDSRDAGLAAEITMGTLRRQGQLDYLIEQAASRPIRKLDIEVAIALRMAIYQTRFLDRVPPYAAVNDSLNLLRQARKVSSVAFANAVLRKLSSADIVVPDDRAVPVWLLDKWTRDFGPHQARAIAQASLEVPRLYQHIPPGEQPPLNATPTGICSAYEVSQPDPRFRIQDLGSQAIVPLLDLRPGERFLDVCAAPGNKTAQAVELAVTAVASDLSFPRLQTLRPLNIPLAVADATRPLPFAPVFDAILVDAPCSGTGTLAHNPEIKWRLDPANLSRFADRQTRILTNALACLAPHGRLVYSTCSLEPEENEHVAQAVAAPRIVRELRRIPGRDPGDGFYAAVIR